MSNTIDTLEDQIKDALSKSGTDVQAQVVEHYVKEEVGRRKGILVKAVAALREYDNQIKKVKPDQYYLDDKGGETQPATYSKGQFEQLKKLREKKDKLIKVVEKALNDNDYENLTKQLNEKE